MAQLWNLLRRNSSHKDVQQSVEQQNTEQQTTHSSSSSSATVETITNDQGASSAEQDTDQKKKKVNKQLPKLVTDQSRSQSLPSNETKESNPINIKSNKDTCSSSAHSPSLSRVSSDASHIFERSVQDQATMSSISRRNSFNQLSPSGKTQSFISLSPNYLALLNNTPSSPQCFQNQIADHLNSDVFIPTCLDATTEILSKKQDSFEDVEVIQSAIPPFTDVLDQTYYHQRKGSITSPSLSRRQTLVSILETPVSRSKSLSYSLPIQQPEFPEKTTTTNPFTSTSLNSSAICIEPKESSDIDYSDHKKLNFCSFADLLSDELLESQLTEQDNSSKIDNVILHKSAQ